VIELTEQALCQAGIPAGVLAPSANW